MHKICIKAPAYMSRYGVRDTLLLFPRTVWMSEDWSERYQTSDAHLKVRLLGVDIAAHVSPDENISSHARPREIDCDHRSIYSGGRGGGYDCLVGRVVDGTMLRYTDPHR